MLGENAPLLLLVPRYPISRPVAHKAKENGPLGCCWLNVDVAVGFAVAATAAAGEADGSSGRFSSFGDDDNVSFAAAAGLAHNPT